MPRGEMTEPAIRIEALSKTYEGGKQALDGVSFDVPRGQIFGLLGPNGAGKSTLINILAGLVVKSSGTARVFGIDIDTNPRRARRAIGVLDKADAYSRSLSGGMRRRLLVAKALVPRPPVVILDEPTAGVDVELRRSLWRYMRELNARGVTVVLTTHYLEEAEQMCDRIAIIDRGTLVAADEKEALMRRLDEKELILTPAAPCAALPPGLADWDADLDPRGRIVVRYRPSRARVGEIIDAVRAAGLTIADLQTREADLEELFLRLTGT